MISKLKIVIALIAVSSFYSCAKSTDQLSGQSGVSVSAQQESSEFTSYDELNPFAENIEEQLAQLDMDYMMATGESPFMIDESNSYSVLADCKRIECKVWAQVVRSTQTMYLYENGKLIGTWKVSTGTKSHGTPNFDRHPNGRIYDKYTSSKYPGGDYNGLGNMPYAVFIHGGFAIHGTGKGNWPKLGQRASHGCIRVHPDNAYTFNRLVRQYGIANTWITVQE